MLQFVHFIAVFAMCLYTCIAQERIIDSLQSQLSSFPSDTTRVRLLNKLCWQYRLSDYPKAIEYGQQALVLSQNIKFPLGEAQAANYLGIVRRNLGQYTEAVEILYHARNIAEKYGLTRELGYAYNNLGDIQRFQGNYAQAVESMLKAAHLFEKQNDTSGIAYAELRLGEVYQAQMHYDEALFHIQKALQLRLALRDSALVVPCYIRMAQIYRAQMRYDTALSVLNYALSLKSLSDKGDLRDSYNTLAHLYLDLHRYSEAVEYANLGLARAKEMMALKSIELSYFILWHASEALGQTQKALEYCELHFETGKKLRLEESKQRESQLDIRYESEKRQREIDMLKANGKIQDLQVRILMAVAIFFIIFAVFSVYTINTRRKTVAQLRMQQSLLEEQAAKIQLANTSLSEAHKQSENLLLNILPASIAERLKSGEHTIAEHFDNVTVLFADIVGFTELSSRHTATEVVNILNRIFSSFDIFSEQYHLEKIKTIGDAYMIVGGLPEPRTDHAEAVARMALEMLSTITILRSLLGIDLSVRIGIHTGSVVAGVIGTKKFAYDLWGDTVNTASRMESQGEAGKIQCSQETYSVLKEQFIFEEREKIEVKGKGMMHTWFLIGTQE